MTRGGHARSGPPPDPNALRRGRKSDKVNYTTLPEHRDGPPPPWPLTRASRRETVVWLREWQRPQAWMWEQLGLELEVALYVRTLVDAEQPGATANTRTLVRQAMESLGLTVAGLARNRWVIATDGASSASAPAEELDVEDGGGSARDRLRLLASG